MEVHKNKIRKKYQLPVYQELPGIRFDINKLEVALKEVENQFVDVVTANKLFCSNNPLLTDNVYGDFEQISLTTIDPNLIDEASKEMCHTVAKTLGGNSEVARFESYRRKSRSKDIHPGMKEKNYNIPTDLYKGSYFEEVVNSFIEPAMRVRLTKIKKGTSLTPHIDYDPSYATRIVIPIRTNKNVINQFWFKNELLEVNLPADGRAYFLNTGFRHAVVNNGDDDRVAFMFSLDGQRDLSQI